MKSLAFFVMAVALALFVSTDASPQALPQMATHGVDTDRAVDVVFADKTAPTDSEFLQTLASGTDATMALNALRASWDNLSPVTREELLRVLGPIARESEALLIPVDVSKQSQVNESTWLNVPTEAALRTACDALRQRDAWAAEDAKLCVRARQLIEDGGDPAPVRDTVFRMAIDARASKYEFTVTPEMPYPQFRYREEPVSRADAIREQCEFIARSTAKSLGFSLSRSADAWARMEALAKAGSAKLVPREAGGGAPAAVDPRLVEKGWAFVEEMLVRSKQDPPDEKTKDKINEKKRQQ